METMPTAQLGKYYLVRHLARGGMSDIYLAREENSTQLYALKVVKQEITDNYEHFRREAAILSSLKHDYILPLIDYHEEEDGLAYYVTPYIQEGSLKERLNQSSLSPEEAGPILSQVGEALQFIHERGLVHRDIKPANILLDRTGHAWLADFGLAKDVSTVSDLTDSNCLFGTPHYLAPELMKDPPGPSSDIYSLGVVLYEMLTGTPPFTGPTLLAIYWKHVDEAPLPPSAFNPAISAAVEQVILQALAKQPEDRFASAREMVEAYQEALLSPAGVGRAHRAHFTTPIPLASKKMVKQLSLGGLHIPEFVQQRQKRLLAVCFTMLVLLFILSLSTLAVAMQDQPATPVSAGAQMILLPRQPAVIGSPGSTPPGTPNVRATPTSPTHVQGKGPKHPHPPGKGPKHPKSGNDEEGD